MLNRTDRNDISAGVRALALIIIAIPLHIVMTLVSAFTGDEPHQHQARAILIAAVVIAIVIALALLGTSPRVLQSLKQFLALS
jgi:hypothetical protein